MLIERAIAEGGEGHLDRAPRAEVVEARFVVALVAIGVVTAIIGDVASLFGCVLGMPDAITAITFVALGTSLPDTFASRSAALADATADAAVGNVTGSNAVNVFLGLGLPWMCAAAFWSTFARAPDEAAWRARYRDEPWYSEGMPVAFAVPAGDLGFSVAVFSGCAAACIGVLVWRRHAYGFELGGPLRPARSPPP